VYWGHEFDLSGHVTAVIGHVTIRLPIGHFLLQHCHGVFNIWYITKIYFCKPRSIRMHLVLVSLKFSRTYVHDASVIYVTDWTLKLRTIGQELQCQGQD